MTVEELLDRWESLRDAGQSVTPEILCAENPELLPEVRLRVVKLAALDGFLYSVAPPAESAGIEPCRYRPLRFHAAGGLGEVYIARDSELQREVALKRIKATHARFGESQERFKREAEITARLEHPGVAPVYGCGVDASGLPFYAMRFIRGETLQAAIKRLHDPASAAAPVSNTSPVITLPKLLRNFGQTCQTIAFAHSQGVIHRDIKPGNVLLGPYGETLVVDWGLARLDQLAGKEANEEAFVAEFGGNSAGQAFVEPVDFHRQAVALRTLGIKGSPAYMSPEQAAGEWKLVGPWSDIYSLGATLYEILTGQAPFTGANTQEILTKVRAGDFSRPREVNRNVPPQLEAICLRAMQLSSERRYPSAAALASDIEAWLEGEPVQAWPEPWSWRTARWLRKHRTAAVTLVSSAAVAVLLLIVMNIALATANRRERAARSLAEEYLKVARASQAEMQQLLLQKISRTNRQQNPEFERVMTDVASRYRQLLDLDPQDARVLMDLAVTNGLRANSLPMAINNPATAALYQETLDDLSAIRQRTDPTAEAVKQRSAAWLRTMHAMRAWRWIEVGEYQKADVDYERAIAGFDVNRPADSVQALLLANTALELSAAATFADGKHPKRLERIDQALHLLDSATPHPVSAADWVDVRAKLQFNRILMQNSPLAIEKLIALAEECQQAEPATAVSKTIAARCWRITAANLPTPEAQLKRLDQAERLLQEPLTVPVDPSSQDERIEELGAVQASYVYAATKGQLIGTKQELKAVADRILQILREESAFKPRQKYLLQMFPDASVEELRNAWTKKRSSLGS